MKRRGLLESVLLEDGGSFLSFLDVLSNGFGACILLFLVLGGVEVGEAAGEGSEHEVLLLSLRDVSPIDASRPYLLATLYVDGELVETLPLASTVRGGQELGARHIYAGRRGHVLGTTAGRWLITIAAPQRHCWGVALTQIGQSSGEDFRARPAMRLELIVNRGASRWTVEVPSTLAGSDHVGFRLGAASKVEPCEPLGAEGRVGRLVDVSARRGS